VAWKAATKAMKRQLWWGWFCGSTMTLTVGVAGLFLHVTGLANGIGDSALGWFNNGGGV
jgi:cell division protein FtsX